MSNDADANSGNEVGNLRRLFDECATEEMRTIQEIDRNICEISDYIEKMQRFCQKKSSEIRELRKNCSDSHTGRMISEYSMAKDMIQKLEKKVAQKDNDIIRLKKDIAQRDLILSGAEKNNLLTHELDAEIARKQILIEEMNRQMVEMRESLEDKDRTTVERASERETKCRIDDKDEIISCLRKTDDDRMREIEKMRQTMIQLQKKLTETENQRCINKRLSNIMKIRQLEPLAKKSAEIEELLTKIKQETADIAERLAFGSMCQPISSNAVTSRTPDRLSRG